MTSQQAALYRAALRIGRAFGTGGSSWTYYEPSGNGYTAAPTLTSQGTITLYIAEAAFTQPRSALPQVSIFQAPWWGAGASGLGLVTDGVLVSVADTSIAFVILGKTDTSQGFSIVPLQVTQTVVAAASGQAGYRSPLWILGVSA